MKIVIKKMTFLVKALTPTNRPRSRSDLFMKIVIKKMTFLAKALGLWADPHGRQCFCADFKKMNLSKSLLPVKNQPPPFFSFERGCSGGAAP